MDLEGFTRLVAGLSSGNAAERAEAGRQLQLMTDWRACLAALQGSTMAVVQFHALRLLRLLLLGASQGDQVQALERLTAVGDQGVDRSVRREWCFVVATLVKLTRSSTLPRDLALLAAVVTEMDFVRCGSYGAPLAWHVAAHFAFQQEQLLRVAQVCLSLPASPQLASLLDAVLSWSWAPPNAIVSSSVDARFAPSRWRPDAAWAQQLDWPRMLRLLGELLGCGPREPVYHALLRLCTLRASEVFGANAAAFQGSLVATCCQVLRLGPDTVVSTHLLSKLVSSVPLTVLLGGGGAVVNGMVEFLLRALDVDVAEEFIDVADEAFSVLFALKPLLSDRAMQGPFAQLCSRAFASFVSCLARKFPTLPVDEVERMSDVLLAATRVGRLVAQPSLAHVMAALQEHRQRAPCVACLIRVAGFFLVEGAEGESDVGRIPPELGPMAAMVTTVVAAIQQRSQLLEDSCFWFFTRWAPVYVASAQQSPFDDAYGKGLPAVKFVDGFLLDFLGAGVKSNASSLLPPLLFRQLCLAPSIGPMLVRSQKWNPLLALAFARLGHAMTKPAQRALLDGIFGIARFFKTDAERVAYLAMAMEKLSVALRGTIGVLVRSLVSSVPPKLGLAAANCFFQLMAAGTMRSPVHVLAALRRFLESDLCELDVARTFELVGRVFEGCAAPAFANAATKEAATKQILRCVERFGKMNWDAGMRQTLGSLSWFWLCKMEHVPSDALLSACLLAPALALTNQQVLMRELSGSLVDCVFEVRRAMNSDEPALLEVVCALLRHALSSSNWTSAQLNRLASLLCRLSSNNAAACFARVTNNVPATLRPPLTVVTVEAALHQNRLQTLKK